MKDLMNRKIMSEYTIKDQQIDEKGNKVFESDEVTPVMDIYTFYTLYENNEKLWGSKQFKKNPITGKKNKQ